MHFIRVAVYTKDCQCFTKCYLAVMQLGDFFVASLVLAFCNFLAFIASNESFLIKCVQANSLCHRHSMRAILNLNLFFNFLALEKMNTLQMPLFFFLLQISPNLFVLNILKLTINNNNDNYY